MVPEQRGVQSDHRQMWITHHGCHGHCHHYKNAEVLLPQPSRPSREAGWPLLQSEQNVNLCVPSSTSYSQSAQENQSRESVSHSPHSVLATPGMVSAIINAFKRHIIETSSPELIIQSGLQHPHSQMLQLTAWRLIGED